MGCEIEWPRPLLTLRGTPLSVWGSDDGSNLNGVWMSGSNRQLEQFNGAAERDAVEMILPCNGSCAWASKMAEARPIPDLETLLNVSDASWWGLPAEAWREAFDSHPRIGERKAVAASAESLQWSEGEQAAARRDAALQSALAEGNVLYEQRFGRIFLICASGRSAAEILAEMERRMGNNEVTELNEAAEQQRQITVLRLRKWLGGEAR